MLHLAISFYHLISANKQFIYIYIYEFSVKKSQKYIHTWNHTRLKSQDKSPLHVSNFLRVLAYPATFKIDSKTEPRLGGIGLTFHCHNPSTSSVTIGFKISKIQVHKHEHLMIWVGLGWQASCDIMFIPQWSNLDPFKLFWKTKTVIEVYLVKSQQSGPGWAK